VKYTNTCSTTQHLFRESYCCWFAIRNIYQSLARFTPFLEELKLDFSALGDDFNDFESRYGMQTTLGPEPSSYTPDFKVGLVGCAEIAYLRRALPVLRTLSVELNGNEIGDLGMDRLTNLKHYPCTLKTLYLGLKNNNIGSESMKKLIAMGTTDTGRPSSLEALHVELEDNHIGTLGAIWLSMFGQGRYGGSIQTLHLGLQNNGIGDIGADILKRNLLRHQHPGFPRDYQGFLRFLRSSLIDSPRLQVNLDRNPIASDHPPQVQSRNSPGNTPLNTDTSLQTTGDGNLVGGV
jgi:hypothetical protein